MLQSIKNPRAKIGIIFYRKISRAMKITFERKNNNVESLSGKEHVTLTGSISVLSEQVQKLCKDGWEVNTVDFDLYFEKDTFERLFGIQLRFLQRDDSVWKLTCRDEIRGELPNCQVSHEIY